VGHARFYDAVRRALGLDEVTVMGFSFGATVALTYAALFPEVARRCVSIAARGVGVEKQDHEQAEETEQFLARHAQAPWYPRARKVWDQWTERVLAAADAAAEVDAMMAEILPLYTADPDLPRVRAVIDGWRGGVRADLRAVKAWEGGLWQTIDIRSLLPRIACPTLLLVGELDLISGPSQASLLSTALPRAQASMRLRTVARQSGYPRAQELFERLREQHFLADLQRSAQDRHRLLIATTRSEPTQASAEEQREASALHVSQRPEVVLV
jgi:pimeloyl-ACP methyl ester carboxylesterase